MTGAGSSSGWRSCVRLRPFDPLSQLRRVTLARLVGFWVGLWAFLATHCRRPHRRRVGAWVAARATRAPNSRRAGAEQSLSLWGQSD